MVQLYCQAKRNLKYCLSGFMSLSNALQILIDRSFLLQFRISLFGPLLLMKNVLFESLKIYHLFCIAQFFKQKSSLIGFKHLFENFFLHINLCSKLCLEKSCFFKLHVLTCIVMQEASDALSKLQTVTLFRPISSLQCR